MSFFPKLLIVPISEAIDPYFASTLVWDGTRNDLWVLEPGAGNVRCCSCVRPIVCRAVAASTEQRRKAPPRLLHLLQAGLHDAHACLLEFLLGRGRCRLDSASRHNPANLQRQWPDLYVLCPLLLRHPLRGVWWLSLVPQATKAVSPAG
jgi:hypothetical protein